ncbi:helix-turn-helix domain-containing protein [Isoptericola sp. NPDC056618]|uniref:helix-turn-helix domain-containing protein n=1 Tax=Isoptericola sp. NPDC056618 TaxID=3345878 RepID=UPI0036C28C56
MDAPANAGHARTREELIELATALAAADETMRRALINARVSAGLSQRQVAELLGIKQSSVASFERHDNDPRLSTIRRYALAVGAQVDHRVCTPGLTVETDGWETVSTPAHFVVGGWDSQVHQMLLEAPTNMRTDFALGA